MAWKEQWAEHRSNLFFFILGSVGWGAMFGSLGHALANSIHGHPTDWLLLAVYLGSGVVLAIISFISFWRGMNRDQNVATPTQGSITPGIPTISALIGKRPQHSFDAKKFFTHAYYSSVTAETESNIKLIAQEFSPSDKEAFYARLIGVGIVAFQHDITALLIFGSQIRAMQEMAASMSHLPLQNLEHHYELAAKNNQAAYERYPFERWLHFLEARSLVVVYPSNMAELSWNGQDFLKYMAHVGKDFSGQPN